MEAGALALKTDLKGRTQQRKQLVKDNFDCFVSCKTTIDGMHPSRGFQALIFKLTANSLNSCVCVCTCTPACVYIYIYIYIYMGM
jgi:hypothetical protein